MKLYLNVPYAEKDNAKALGAKWDARVKKWYFNGERSDYAKFSEWILRDTDDAVIATDYIYLIEGVQRCWKCGRLTRVIGLAIGEFVHIYGETDDPQYEFWEDYADEDEELHLAWEDREEDIPPPLINYLKQNYSVKTGDSKTIGGE